jgi:alpha-tubulin suppressor-like RCC1 family protein
MATRLRNLVATAILLPAALHFPRSDAADLNFPIVSPGDIVVPVGRTVRLVTTGNFTDATIRPLSNATLAAGGNHVCVLVADGEIRCWGRGTSGQLGHGDNADYNVPTGVAGLDNATALAAGGDSSCALLADASVRCWGLNDVGQLGNGSNAPAPIPVTVTGVSAVAIAMGFRHACAVLANGGVRCWGANGAGQLGNGGIVGSSTAVAVTGIANATAVATGGNHSCALLASGGVKCWGDGGVGQLGNGGFAGSSTPVNVTGISDAVAIATGFNHSCALIAGGSLRCWGGGLAGELGNGNFANSSTPLAVPLGAARAVTLAAGSGHTCVVLETGTMQCWGRDANGQLGNNAIVGNFASPVTVVNMSKAIAVAAGFEHTCAVLSDGNTKCWGLNDGGQLGTGLVGGINQRSGVPLTVSGPVLVVDAGGHHTCAITPTGTGNCWGYGFYGQLGNDAAASSAVPVGVVRLDNSAGAAAVNGSTLGLGFDHSCATVTGPFPGAKCWGRNNFVQLGANNIVLDQSNTALDVFQSSSIVRVASGSAHSCGLYADGTVGCWGSNAFFALGNSEQANPSFPRPVVGIAGATRITAGLNHTCALLSSGTVMCWGRGDEGQLGNGLGTTSATPVAVSGITNATFIGAGNSHTCARLVGGAVRCWGRNVEGQLGNSSFVGSLVPVNVTGITTATTVTGGGFHTCATLNTGGVNCWGRGDQGQLGNGFLLNISGPVVVTGLSGAVAVDAGRSHTCAIISDGRLRCWGYNEFGQLGNGVSGAGAISSTIVAVSGINMDAPALALSSGDSTVASVDMSGHVHSNALGETTIIARYDSRATFINVTVAPDTDADGVADPIDNCSLVPNGNLIPDVGGHSQLNTDGDLYGNICDPDFNNSGLVTTTDFVVLRNALNTANPLADLNGSGLVTTADFTILRNFLNKAPGPCCGLPP